MESLVSLRIAVNYQSRVKNCASAIYPSNIRNPLPRPFPYLYQQNHCPDISPRRRALGGRSRPAIQQDLQAPGLHGFYKTL